MYADIVVPNNNEESFVVVAEKLGYRAIVFLYEPEKYRPAAEVKQLLDKKGCKTKLILQSGIITNSKNVQKARNNSDLVVVWETENIREAVERAKPDIIFGMEEQQKRDFMHQRNSGINQVVCDIAKEKHVYFGISMGHILSSRSRHVLFGRMMQNIRLYRKYENQFVFASFAQQPYEMRAPKDIISLLVVLGVDSKPAKNSLNQVNCIIERNKKIRERRIIADGAEIVGDA